jgi:chromosome segregation ATPase
VNEKLKKFWKGFVSFMGKNWIAIVIIGGLLFMSGTCSKIANGKIDKRDAEIAELNKKNKELKAEMEKNKEAYLLLDIQLKEILKEIEVLEKEKAEIEKEKAKIAKKYADLREKFGNLSQAQQDQLLVDLLKKYEITAEVRENSLVITMTDRGKLYTFIISIDEVREKLKNSDEGWVNCKATVEEQNKIIGVKDGIILLKDGDIEKLNQIILNKDEIIKDYKSKLFWTKVGSWGKKAIPALIVGLVVGFMVAK